MRRIDNPLFGDRRTSSDDAALLEAQRRDHEELLAFLGELRSTVQRAVGLRPNEGSEVVLELKEQLDRLYEVSAGLADEHGDNQAAIRELLEVIMRNVERGATGDPQAVDELAGERAARELHFGLLRSPLVADLLHPQSTIVAGDLVPSLLSATAGDLAAALQLFDPDQLDQLYTDATRCLADCDDAPADAAARLQQIAAAVPGRRPTGPIS